jgi:hypothetical protein
VNLANDLDILSFLLGKLETVIASIS